MNNVVADDAWIHSIRESHNSKVRLICFAHAGGGLSSFSIWKKYLPDWVDIYSIVLPGRDTRFQQPLCIATDEIVEAVMERLRSWQSAKPLALYGHSLGSILAFEVARSLQCYHFPLLALYVSGRRAPQKKTNIHFGDLAEPELIEALRVMQGAPEFLLNNRRWIDTYLPIIRADLRLSDNYSYQPAPPLQCLVSTFLGSDDPLITRSDWQAWQLEAGRDFSAALLPGAHFFNENGRQQLTQSISESLARFVENCDWRAVKSEGGR